MNREPESNWLLVGLGGAAVFLATGAILVGVLVAWIIWRM